MKQMREFRDYFDPLFLQHLGVKMEVIPETSYFVKLKEHILHLAAGGKRLRPFVALLGYEEENSKERAAVLPLLYALEIFHLFALIHDDIIDDADERHGVPCIHAAFGRAQAILAGDLCLAWAYEDMATYKDLPAIAQVFALLAQETISGQMLDVALAGEHPVTEKLLDIAVDYKTARYTFTYPLTLGRLLAGKSEDLQRYAELGHHLGNAFQRLDDLADVFWDQEQLGKKPGADIRQGLPTHLSFFVSQHGTSAEREYLAGCRGKEVDMLAVQELFRESGAVEMQKHHVTESLEKIRTILADLNLSEYARTTWDDCVDLLTQKLYTFG